MTKKGPRGRGVKGPSLEGGRWRLECGLTTFYYLPSILWPLNPGTPESSNPNP